MKIAYVYGDDDYAALSFESDGYGVRLGELEKLISSNEFKDKCYTVEIKEFEHVDISFISWLKSHVLDAEHCKHSNFYIIRESVSIK